MPTMKTLGTSSFGAAQRKKLAEVLARIREFHFPVSIYDVDEQYVFELTVRELVVQLQTLAAPILTGEIADRLESIRVDEHDFHSASIARARLKAIVPAVEDALDSLDNELGPHLPGSLERLLNSQELDTVSEQIERAVINVETDPPVAVTASRAALESLLKVYIEDGGLGMPNRPKTGGLLQVAMKSLGLDPANKKDRDVKRVLQSLWSVVHGIADLRTHAGSAHGHGRRVYRLHTRHARLAFQASQAFIEFFVETWNYREGRSSSD